MEELTFFSGRGNLNTDVNGFIFNWLDEVKIYFNFNIQPIEELDVNTDKKSFIFIKIKINESFIFNENILAKIFGFDTANNIVKNKNIFFIFVDIYDSLDVQNCEDFNFKNSFSDRSFFISAAHEYEDAKNLFKKTFTIPFWLLHFQKEQSAGWWPQENIVDNHSFNEKKKFFLSLVRYGKYSRDLFYTLGNKEILNNSLWSYVSQGKRLDNDLPQIDGFSKSDRFQQKLWYSETMFSVVHETHFDKAFLTEKTIKPIVNLHPFLIIGNPSYLSYLKKIGFELDEINCLMSDIPEITPRWRNDQYRDDLTNRINYIWKKIEFLYNMPPLDLFNFLYSPTAVNIRINNKRKILNKSWCKQTIYTMSTEFTEYITHNV